MMTNHHVIQATPPYVLISFFFGTAATFSACGAANCPASAQSIVTPESQPAAPQVSDSEPADTAPSVAPPMDEAAALTRLLTVSPIEPDWFDEKFQKAVPTSQIEQLVASTHAELGAFQSVTKGDGKYEATFEKGVLPCSVALDENGRFSGLWFHPLRLKIATFEDARKMIDALGGNISVLVVDDAGNDLFAQRPEEPLAVGSAFKLAVLDALNQKIGKKKRLWKETIALQDKHRSLPSGQLHEWPVNSELTLSTLSNLMISISDNTATDMLLDWVGRDRVEKEATRNRPFLSTRELFVLKSESNKNLLDKYRAADEKQRRKILEEIASLTLPKVGELSDQVSADVEWFFSARELCSMIFQVAHLPAMQINPGLVDKNDFDEVAFKGGSEKGVLNFTTWVKKGKRSACIAATWNHDRALDSQELAQPYRALIAATRTRLAAE